MDDKLFNGEYYQQEVDYRHLHDQSFVEMLAANAKNQSESAQLLRDEGPKYQYGAGCLSDAAIGAWMSQLYGVDAPFNTGRIQQTLRAIFRHNFKRDLSTPRQLPAIGLRHRTRRRPPALFMARAAESPRCPSSTPDEVWTGIEYQVASHLIAVGQVQEGLALVKTVRKRYDGKVRNPWNEYECGSYYARAMSSYTLLPALAGFRYSAVEQALWFGPKTAQRPYTTFFSTASGFGTITLAPRVLTIELIEGKLPLKRLHRTIGGVTPKSR